MVYLGYLRNIRGRMTFSIETMFELKAKCIQFTCIVNPCTLDHPYRLCFAFTADHQKYWTAFLIKRIIHKITLQVHSINQQQKCKKKMKNIHENPRVLLLFLFSFNSKYKKWLRMLIKWIDNNFHSLVSIADCCLHQNDRVFDRTKDPVAKILLIH